MDGDIGVFYSIRRDGPDLYTIMGFDGDPEPTRVYTVERKRDGTFVCDCPGFRKAPSQDHKHIKLVKLFRSDKEPLLASYWFDEMGKIHSKIWAQDQEKLYFSIQTAIVK